MQSLNIPIHQQGPISQAQSSLEETQPLKRVKEMKKVHLKYFQDLNSKSL